MKFVVSTAAVVALMGCMAPEKWRPKKMMALAKESEKGSATQLTKKAAGMKIKEVLKKRRTLDFSKRMESLKEDEEENKIPDVSFLELSQSQKKTLSPPKNRELQSTCSAGYVDCVNGQYDGDDCSVECGGDCCVGDLACAYFTGKVCKDGSCSGEYACSFGAIRTVINGCMGDRSCTFVGYENGANTGSIGEIIDSCNADYGCYQAASFAGEISSIVGSCNSNKGCLGAGISSVIGKIENSCNAPSACRRISIDGNLTAVVDTCNAMDACEEFGANQPVFGALIDCCDTPYECNNTQSFPFQCLENFISSHSFESCDVNHNSYNDVKLMCTFNSTYGVPATAEIKSGTCTENGGFAMEADSAQTTDTEITASFDLTPTITATDKNSGFFQRSYCVRSDIFTFFGTNLMSLAALKYDIEANFTYSNQAVVELANIELVPYVPGSATASSTRSVDVNVALGDCTGGSLGAPYAIGSVVTVCVSVSDSDVEMRRIVDVTISDPPDTIINSDGDPNFLTTIDPVPTRSANISTLLIASHFDTGNDFITMNGVVRLRFISQRALRESRHLVEDSTEDFSLQIPIIQPDQPDFVEEPDNSGNFFGSGMFSVALGLFVYLWV